MLTAVIIDDETKGRIALRQKLADYCPEVKLVAEAGSGEEGLALIETHQPDIVFLDIEMPSMTGFEMLQHIKSKNFHLIFTTAYDQYAIKAIKYAAFDYLLKPVDIDELKLAISNLKEASIPQTTKQVALLNENINHPQRKLHKLAIPSSEGLSFYDINDIVRLEASSNYTNIFLTDKTKILASKTLKEFEELLPEDVFFRPHYSHLINLNYIKRYLKTDGGVIEMQNGDQVDISRRNKEAFLKIIGQ